MAAEKTSDELLEIDEADEELELSLMEEDDPSHEEEMERVQPMQLEPLDGSFVELEECENDNKDTQCSICDKKFKHRRSFKRHLAKHSSSEHSCSICTLKFPSEETLQKHMDTRHTKVYVCEVCGTDCKTNQSLNIHKIRKHNAEGKEKRVCPYQECSKVFVKKTCFEDHVNNHLKIRPFKCDKCDKTFMNRYEKTRHNKSCGSSTSIKCTVCGRSFSCRQNLAIHTASVHQRISYHCTCGKEYKYITGLNRHKKSKGH